MAEQAQITLFTGAGASKPFGYQLTDEITHQLLSGDCFTYRNQLQGRFILEKDNVEDKMVNLITDVCQELLKGSPNYEQIYSDIMYISRARKNPSAAFHLEAIKLDQLIESKITKHFGGIEKYRSWLVSPESDLYRQTWALASNYISNSVRQLLWEQRDSVLSNIDKLSVYYDLARNDNFKRLHLFTINHDKLFEDYFDKHNISYLDFVKEKPDANEVEVLDPSTETRIDYRVILYKLHGSVDWFESERLQPGGVDDFLGDGTQTPFDYRIPYVEKVTDVSATMTRDYPEIDNNRFGVVIGTDKAEEYVNYPYLFLLAKFVKHLQDTNYLVIIGYSFRDLAINRILRDWRDKDPMNRRVLLITKGADWRHNLPPFKPDKTREDGIENVTAETIVDFVTGG